jgi:superfamily II DNA/RNA helicase
MTRDDDPDDDDLDDDTREALDGAADARRSRALPAVTGRARVLLDAMLALAQRHRDEADGRVLALHAWMRAHQCEALGGDPRRAKGAAWSDRRLLIFTEYGDTKRWLVNLLQNVVEPTAQGSGRVMQFHGGMSDAQREEVRRAFNSAPGEHPVRVLVATDAAREGVNLQGHCADLFHFDIPWNPARMEQRNGRIDRTLQPAEEVRCHYFVLPQRAEDQVLRTLVKKVERISEELGSLSAVVMDRLADALAAGIDPSAGARVEAATQLGLSLETTRRELDSDAAASSASSSKSTRRDGSSTSRVR